MARRGARRAVHARHGGVDGRRRRTGARRRALRRSHRQRRPRRPRRRRPRRARRARAAAAAAWRRSHRARTWRGGPARTGGTRRRKPTPRNWPTPPTRGDPIALRAFRRGATAVAAMIASVGAVCDLDLRRHRRGSGEIRRAAVRPGAGGAARPTRGLDFLRDLRVVPAELGGDAGLVGAAALVISRADCFP